VSRVEGGAASGESACGPFAIKASCAALACRDAGLVLDGKVVTVRRKFALLTGAAACCLLLAACSGNKSPTPAPTPTPTGTPTPSPTPTPTPTPVAVDFDFAKAFTATITGTSYIYAYFTPTGGTESWSDGSRVGGSSKIEYAIAPENVAFTFPDALPLTAFGAADRVTDTPTLRAYRKGTEGLTLELPFSQVLRVSYEHSQNFVRETVAGVLRSTRVTLFFNVVTTTAAITSNLSYTGTAQVVGGKPGTAAGAFTSEPATITVAASDKKITGSIKVFETVGGVKTLRAVLPISGTVAADNTFSGTIDDTTNAFKGTFVGSLAGPSRQEAVFIFNVAHTDGRELIGSFIGS
jgi:hypothetical protein